MNAREREAQFARRQSAAEFAEESGGYTPTSFKIPQGMKRYKLSKGIQDFDIIPFLASAIPFKQPKADPGQSIWYRSYGRHKLPSLDGTSSDFYLCLWETFDKPCPVCRFLQSNRGLSKDWQTYFRAQRRFVTLINDRPGDQTNPLKLHDAVYYNRDVGFGQQLQNALTMNKPEWDYFWDWEKEDGRTLRVMCTDEDWQKVGNIAMIRRAYAYPFHVVEHAPCLDECFLVPHPKELDGVPLSDYTAEDWKKVYEELDAFIHGNALPIAPPKFVDKGDAGGSTGQTGASTGGSSTSDPKLPPARGETRQELPATAISTTPPPQAALSRQGTQAPSQSSPQSASGWTKPSCPYKVGDRVIHLGLECEVKAIDGGRLLTLLDKDDDLYEDVPFAAVKPIGGRKPEGKLEEKLEGNGSHSTPSPAKAQVRKGLDDDDALDDIMEDENEDF